MSTGKLWCGKASAFDCLNTLLLTISNLTYTNFPKMETLSKFQEFMSSDKSGRFSKRMETLEAPPNTGKIPLEQANVSLLVKLFVNRLDLVCIEYFHSNTSADWKPRNKYGEQLLEYWNTFNKEFITSVLEYVKQQKSPDEKKMETLKTLLPKTQGVWGQRILAKLSEIEKSVQELKEKQIPTESVDKDESEKEEDTENTEDEKVPEVKPKPIVAKKVKTRATTEKKQVVDDGEGEWISVGKNGKQRNSKQHKPQKHKS